MSHSVVIPPGTTHHNTTIFCQTWEAYDSFEAGETHVEDPPLTWKAVPLDEGRLTVFPPVGERPTEGVESHA